MHSASVAPEAAADGPNAPQPQAPQPEGNTPVGAPLAVEDLPEDAGATGDLPPPGSALPSVAGPPGGQADEMHHIFRQFDLDNSGELELREIMSAMRLLGINKSMKEVKTVMGKFDTSGNGKLGRDEFQALLDEFGGIVPMAERKATMYVPEKKGYLQRKRLFGKGEKSWETVYAVIYGARMESFDYKYDWYQCVHGSDDRPPTLVSKHRVELKLKGQTLPFPLKDQVATVTYPNKRTYPSADEVRLAAQSFAITVPHRISGLDIDYVYRATPIPDGAIPNDEALARKLFRCARFAQPRTEDFTWLKPDGSIVRLPIGSTPTEEQGDCYSLPIFLDELVMERKVRWEEDPHPECVKPMNAVQVRQWKAGVYKKDKKTGEYIDPHLAEDGDEYANKCDEWKRITEALCTQDAKEWAEALQRVLDGRDMETAYEEKDRGLNSMVERSFGFNPKWGNKYAMAGRPAGPKKCSLQ